MKILGRIFIGLFLLPLFFTGNVIAAESNSEVDNHTPISFDGEVEKVTEKVPSRKQENRISLPYEGTGNSLNFNNVDEGQAPGSEDSSGYYDTFSIIGSDNRTTITATTSFPYRAIVKLSVKFPNSIKTSGCTGFMVNKDTLVTAGHCVYSQTEGGWAKEITASPGRNGSSTPYGNFDWKTIHTVNGWKNNGDPNYDYGAIKLSGTPGNNTGWFGYRTTNASSPENLTVNVTGYPCDKPDGTMWTHSGKVLSVMARQLGYNADTMGCQSGSPVYRNYSDSGQSAIAIHAYGASGSPLKNKGTGITNDVFDNISEWEK